MVPRQPLSNEGAAVSDDLEVWFEHPAASTVTLFSGEGPHMINDNLSREPSQLLASLGWSAAGVWKHKSFPLYGHYPRDRGR
jgi:hypothetical protein